MILRAKKIIEMSEKFDRDMKARGAEYKNKPIRAELVKSLYEDWRASLQELERTAQELNKLSKTFTPENREKCTELSKKREALERETETKKRTLDEFVDHVPNFLDPKVPLGKNSQENLVVGHHHKTKRSHSTQPKSDYSDGEVIKKHHEDIAQELGMWWREEAVNMSGSRFAILTGKLAKLERALAQFALDENEKAGFLEVSVPFLVRKESLYNTGDLPKFAEDCFLINDDRALIPTGEVPLVNLVYGKKLEQLPAKFTACTPCFRKEAGSLGRDTKGLIRLHQFQKVELVAITDPEASADMHMQMLDHIKHLLDLLELPYRVIELCSGDIGFKALRQFDVEVFMPSAGDYVEVASCSNCGDFQSIRMGTKNASGEFVHTLNGTAVACGRLVAAILEHHYSEDELIIPEALKKYY